jgi:sugar/nucleoside kinase (ribokinase family)
MGSVLVNGKTLHPIPAHPVATVVDTTGAGDLYAAGVLYGLSQGLDLPACGRLGSLAAAEVIAHVGARPMVPLADLAASVLG